MPVPALAWFPIRRPIVTPRIRSCACFRATRTPRMGCLFWCPRSPKPQPGSRACSFQLICAHVKNNLLLIGAYIDSFAQPKYGCANVRTYSFPTCSHHKNSRFPVEQPTVQRPVSRPFPVPIGGKLFSSPCEEFYPSLRRNRIGQLQMRSAAKPV